MITDFIDSVLIIDDKEDEIKELKELLEKNDIWTKYYAPETLKTLEAPLKNRKIIFLDLYIDSKEPNVKGQISIIRKLFKETVGKDFGTYGVVLWSAHTNEIDELKNKMQNDADEYTLPLFIIGLEKAKYLGKSFDGLFDDLNQELGENTAASFFIKWSTLVNQGRDKAIKNIYSLVQDYEKQDMNLQFILFQLARNYTGIPYDELEDYPLHNDALKSFNDMMAYEITSNQDIANDLFVDTEKISFIGISEDTKDYTYHAQNRINGKTDDKKIKKSTTELTKAEKKTAPHDDAIKKLESEIYNVYADINSKLLIDNITTNQNKVIPGNIYEIIDTSCLFKVNDIPEDSKGILIEMTPPCDFANKSRISPRVLGGFMSKYTNKELGNYSKDYYYKYMWPFNLEGQDNPQMCIFDYRYFGFIEEDKLKDASQYKLLFRAKDRLFADILQKLSSHTARLGLSIIH